MDHAHDQRNEALSGAELTTTLPILAALFLFGSIGTGTELLLMEHTEGVWQNVPLALIGIGCIGFAAFARKRGATERRAFHAVLGLFVVSGLAGVLLHYQGNREFELELNPDAAGVELFWETMKGATPALAPATMILLGVLGFSYSRITELE
jgi:hypothetical protein